MSKKITITNAYLEMQGINLARLKSLSNKMKIMDVHLAMQELGSSRDEAYDLLELVANETIGNAKKDPDKFMSEKDNEISELQDRIDELVKINSDLVKEKTRLLSEINGIRAKIDDIERQQIKMTSGWGCEAIKHKIDKKIEDLVRKFETSINTINIDSEIERLHRLQIKVRSFVYRNDHDKSITHQKETTSL